MTLYPPPLVPGERATKLVYDLWRPECEVRLTPEDESFLITAAAIAHLHERGNFAVLIGASVHEMDSVLVRLGCTSATVRAIPRGTYPNGSPRPYGKNQTASAVLEAHGAHDGIATLNLDITVAPDGILLFSYSMKCRSTLDLQDNPCPQHCRAHQPDVPVDVILAAQQRT